MQLVPDAVCSGVWRCTREGNGRLVVSNRHMHGRSVARAYNRRLSHLFLRTVGSGFCSRRGEGDRRQAVSQGTRRLPKIDRPSHFLPRKIGSSAWGGTGEIDRRPDTFEVVEWTALLATTIDTFQDFFPNAVYSGRVVPLGYVVEKTVARLPHTINALGIAGRHCLNEKCRVRTSVVIPSRTYHYKHPNLPHQVISRKVSILDTLSRRIRRSSIGNDSTNENR